MEELIKVTEDSISTMTQRLGDDRGKYVMANDTYVQTEECKGLAGTNLIVRCPNASCKAVCFSSEEEAYRSGDYFLKDGAGRPILLKPLSAEEFFSEEIANAKEMVALIKERKFTQAAFKSIGLR